MKDFASKLDSTSRQLEELQRKRFSADEKTNSMRDKEDRWNEERVKFQDEIREAESHITRLEIQKKGLVSEQARTQGAITEKNAEIKVNSINLYTVRSCILPNSRLIQTSSLQVNVL